MNAVERVKSICKERKIAISKLENDCGFSNAYISQLRKGTFPNDRLEIISKYLGVSIDYLITGKEKEFTIEMAKKDLALSNMSERIKDYALKISKMSAENQEFIMQMIDKLEDKKGE